MLINMQQFFAEWGEIELTVERGGGRVIRAGREQIASEVVRVRGPLADKRTEDTSE